MNKELAEAWVKNSESSKGTERDSLYAFVVVNLVCFAIAAALYRHSTFVITMAVLLFADWVFTIAVAREKPNHFWVTVLLMTHFITLCTALNCIVFALYQFINA